MTQASSILKFWDRVLPHTKFRLSGVGSVFPCLINDFLVAVDVFDLAGPIVGIDIKQNDVAVESLDELLAQVAQQDPLPIRVYALKRHANIQEEPALGFGPTVGDVALGSVNKNQRSQVWILTTDTANAGKTALRQKEKLFDFHIPQLSLAKFP